MMINDKSSFFERKAPNMISIVVSVVIFGKSMLINSITSTRNLSSYHRARDINMNHAVFILIYTCIVINDDMLIVSCSPCPADFMFVLCFFPGVFLVPCFLWHRSQKRSAVSALSAGKQTQPG